ncbi:antirestriction protein ArdA [Streptomyces antarcticus]|uniref:antirestriction protein ArdA n=1 Tax=Streptomyces antarcticus TaxID=2996458 RepID=UPI002272171E|nr:antirestriction protein ArdA [Streptomyces sp. H34-AA3]MCY0946809.1 antirestriction protein ArdA [Streptomyces sp. H34-AA3]
MFTATRVQPRVWIGCLSCYNAGRLVGDWYEAETADDVTPDDLHGRATSHEELWVFDHEYFYGAIESECSPHEAAEIARALSELTDDESGAFAAWFTSYAERDERDEWVEKFRDAYRGFHDSEADFAREWFEETSSEEEVERLTQWPYRDIDWERASHELFTGGFSAEDAPGGVHVFYVG